MPGLFPIGCSCLPALFHTCAAVHCTHPILFVPGRKIHGGEICKKHYRQLERMVRGIVLDWWEVQIGLGLVREEEGRMRGLSRGDGQ
jgi:hypothetical protein